MMIHQIDKCKYGNPQIAQGAFGSISIAILSKIEEPQQFSFVATKTIRNALDPSLFTSSYCNRPSSSSSKDHRRDDTISGQGKNRPTLSPGVFAELAALRVLSSPNHRHDNITPLLSIITSSHSSSFYENEISFVFPYCPMDLHQIIQTHRFQKDRSAHCVSLEFSVIRTILRDILNGLYHIHSLGIIHGDMKPGNILLDTRGIFQLADFGLAQLTVETKLGSNNVVGVDKDTTLLLVGNEPLQHFQHPQQGLCTLPYRPPEILLGSMNHLHQPSVDMWGLGLILCEMLSGRALFYGVSVLDQLSKIMDVLGTPTRESWQGLEDLPDYGKVIFDPRQGLGLGMVVNEIQEDELLESLVNGLVVMDPGKRKSASDCLNHDWMGSARGTCSRMEIKEKLIPSQFLSCYDGIRVGDFTDEMKEYLLEQMKLNGAEIALQRRKYRPGPNQDYLDNNDDVSSLQVSNSLPSVFSSKLKACLEQTEEKNESKSVK
jgi:Serine/threonine protein kinase